MEKYIVMIDSDTSGSTPNYDQAWEVYYNGYSTLDRFLNTDLPDFIEDVKEENPELEIDVACLDEDEYYRIDVVGFDKEGESELLGYFMFLLFDLPPVTVENINAIDAILDQKFNQK